MKWNEKNIIKFSLMPSSVCPCSRLRTLDRSACPHCKKIRAWVCKVTFKHLPQPPEVICKLSKPKTISLDNICYFSELKGEWRCVLRPDISFSQALALQAHDWCVKCGVADQGSRIFFLSNTAAFWLLICPTKRVCLIFFKRDKKGAIFIMQYHYIV